MILESNLATVLSVGAKADPDKQFGVRVQIDEILAGEEYPVVARPLFPANLIKSPKPGQTIEVLTVGKEGGEFDEGDESLGPEEFAEFCYYTGRIFDLKDGKVPTELKTNYPKRSGMWTDDGSIIYMDDTKGSLEIALVLQGGTQKIGIKENILFFDSIKVAIGAEGADEPILLGKQMGDASVSGSLAKFLTDWTTATTAVKTTLNALVASPPVDPTALANALNTWINALSVSQGLLAIASWLSTKTFIDQ